jgi:hypothetical protein
VMDDSECRPGLVRLGAETYNLSGRDWTPGGPDARRTGQAQWLPVPVGQATVGATRGWTSGWTGAGVDGWAGNSAAWGWGDISPQPLFETTRKSPGTPGNRTRGKSQGFTNY